MLPIAHVAHVAGAGAAAAAAAAARPTPAAADPAFADKYQDAISHTLEQHCQKNGNNAHVHRIADESSGSARAQLLQILDGLKAHQ